MKTEVNHDIKIHEFKKGILHLPVGTVFFTEHGALWMRADINHLSPRTGEKATKEWYHSEGAVALVTGVWMPANVFTQTIVTDIKGSFVHEPLPTFPEL